MDLRLNDSEGDYESAGCHTSDYFNTIIGHIEDIVISNEFQVS